MRPANKSALADAILALMPKYVVRPTARSQYVLDGGSLVHRIPWWQRGTTYNDFCRLYTNYVTRRYGHAIIVFVGYQEELSTEDCAHERRTMDFTRDMVMKSTKEDLLSNKDNKQRFIKMLGQSLEHVGCETRHAKGDAYVLIVGTTVTSAMSCETTLVGDDTDLLVLLYFHVKGDYCEVFFKPEVRSGTKKRPRCWNIKYVQRVLGRAVCHNMLFAHAILGCDPTYRVFSREKGLALKHIRSDKHFITQAEVFLQENATLADISSAGEAAPVRLYTSAVDDTLDTLRLQRFQ